MELVYLKKKKKSKKFLICYSYSITKNLLIMARVICGGPYLLETLGGCILMLIIYKKLFYIIRAPVNVDKRKYNLIGGCS